MKNLRPLPVSEEMLGAYLEGNLSAEELSMVEGLIDSDAVFQDFVGELSIPDSMFGESLCDTFPTFDAAFELPSIPEYSFQQFVNLSPESLEDLHIASVISEDEEISLLIDENTEIQTTMNEGDPDQTSFSMPEDSNLDDNDDLASTLEE